MRPHQVSNSNFIRALFTGAMAFDVPNNDSQEIESNNSGINSVFDFTQVNHYYTMQIPSELMTNPINEITMMAWVRPTKHGDIRVFDSSVAGENFGGFGFDLYGQRVRFLGSRRDDASQGVNCHSSNNQIITGEWNHCCVTFKDGDMRIYIDGVLDSVYNSSLTHLDVPLQNKLCIGYSNSGHPGSGYFEGYMSQLSIWNVALTDVHVDVCSKHNLLLLKESGIVSDTQYFINSELNYIFKRHALIYLPYLEWKNERVQNFGISTEDLNIQVMPNRLSAKRNLASSYEKSQFSTLESADHPVFRESYWTQELHQYFPKEKRDLIILLLLISNRHAPIIGELPGEVLELVFSFLD